MTAAETSATLAADRVDFVDENDRFPHATSLLKEVSDAARAYTDEHFHKVRAGDAEESNPCFTRHRSGEQGLAGSGRADEKNALRDPGTNFCEPLRHAKEVDNFGYFLLHPVVTGDIGECRRRLVGRICLRFAATD